MLNELNKVIVREVKDALSLLPDKEISGKHLCRVIVGPDADYEPRDLTVDKVWLNEDGDLCFSGVDECYAGTAENEWTEYDSLYDITDFHYLITQIAAMVDDCEVEYINKWELKTNE